MRRSPPAPSTTGWWNITGTPGGHAGEDQVAHRGRRRRGGPGRHPEGAGQQRRTRWRCSSRAMFGGQNTPGDHGQRGGRGVVPLERRARTRRSRRPSTTACTTSSGTGPPTGPRSTPPPAIPYIFRIGSSYHYGTCESGQWTSLLVDANDVPSVRGLIENGNPTQLSIGTEIWIQPGTKTSLYNDVIVPSVALLPGSPGREHEHPRPDADHGLRAVPHHRVGRRQREVHRGLLRRRLRGPGRHRRRRRSTARSCRRRSRSRPQPQFTLHGPGRTPHPIPALSFAPAITCPTELWYPPTLPPPPFSRSRWLGEQLTNRKPRRHHS